MTTKADEAVAAMQKKNLEAAMALAQMSIESSQRILQLQVDAAKNLFEDGVSSTKALAAVTTPQEAVDLRVRYAQQTAEKMLECSRGVAAITAELQAAMTKMMSSQLNQGGQEMMEALQSMMKGMPMNSQAAAEAMQTTFDTARKALEQVAKASGDAFSAFTNAPSSQQKTTTSRRS
jgi:phasin family protein